ncbi:MAG: ribosome silencing factor [Lentisphaerae bacterium]|nr:ribosome silencing factor [Lentisphaerota bacterium]
MTLQQFVGKILTILDAKKAMDVNALDVRGKSQVADYYIVVTGSSPPHLKAMFNDIQHELKQAGVQCYRKAGDPESGWMTLDYVDVVIHIFLKDVRDYYAIEMLWESTPATDPASQTHPTQSQ